MRLKDKKHCPDCGYTKEDSARWLDHHLCKGTIPEGAIMPLTDGELPAENRRRLATFKRDYLGAMDDLAGLPATIIGKDGRDICLLDATLDDLQHYAALLERRIAREKRNRR